MSAFLLLFIRVLHSWLIDLFRDLNACIMHDCVAVAHNTYLFMLGGVGELPRLLDEVFADEDFFRDNCLFANGDLIFMEHDAQCATVLKHFVCKGAVRSSG